MRTTCLVTAIVLTAVPAAADPVFLTLDRQDAQSRVGGELSYILIDQITSLRIDLHGQYVTPQGFGGYAALPIAYASGNGDSITTVADAEVGGIFIPRLASPNWSLILHAGVTLPIASDDLDDVLVDAVATTARLTDAVLIIPQGLTLRLGIAPMIRSGQFFGRLDGGVDLNLARSGDGTSDPLLRLNLGGGIDLGAVAFTGELVNIFSTDSDASDQSSSAIAIGVRGVAGSVRPYGGIVIPLDDDFANVDAAITGGLEGVL